MWGFHFQNILMASALKIHYKKAMVEESLALTFRFLGHRNLARDMEKQSCSAIQRNSFGLVLNNVPFTYLGHTAESQDRF